MKLTKKQMRKGFTLVELLVVIAIIAVLAGLATPAILKAKKSADKAQAVNNAKQLGLAMQGFDQDYGSYPSDETAEILRSEGEDVRDGDTSNDFFSQLLVADATDSEKIFYAKGVKGTREGDNIFNSRDKALEKSECSFGYVMLTGNEALSQSSSRSSTPLACAPLKSGGTDPEFDENPYAGEYVAVQADASATTGKVKEGKGLLRGQGRRTLFTNGDDTIWEDDQPEVIAPASIQ